MLRSKMKGVMGKIFKGSNIIDTLGVVGIVNVSSNIITADIAKPGNRVLFLLDIVSNHM